MDTERRQVCRFKVDMTGGRGKCIKRSVQIAKKSAKFLLSLEGTARFTAKNAIQNEKIVAVRKNWRIGELGDTRLDPN